MRGSIPTPVSECLGIGGNTSCIEVRARGNRTCFIVDAGSGVRLLGESLAKPSQSLAPVEVFLTHFHWDHIQGLPFFPPLFDASAQIGFHSGLSAEAIRDCLEGQMNQPYFPVPFSAVRAKRRFAQIDPGKPVQFDNLRVQSFQLNHPQGAFGYRFDADDSTMVHVCDHEQGNPAIDAEIRKLAQGASVLICDAQYTPLEYEGKHGWGHSTWREAALLAKEADVERLFLFHHDPTHDDRFLEAMLLEAKDIFSKTELAREGLALEF